MFKAVDIRILFPGSVPPRLRYITAQKTVTISHSSFKTEAFCNITPRLL